MSDHDNDLIKVKSTDEGFVVLPLDESQFRDFISGLLGRPQTLAKELPGTYKLERDDVRSLNTLIGQRIGQQNTAVLLRFSATLFFSDNTSVEMASLDELVTYSEPRSVSTRALSLEWMYLIRFQDKDFPERQEISIVFSGASGGHGRGLVKVSIDHTARTWALDMIMMLSGFLDRLFIVPSRWAAFIERHHIFLSVIAGYGLFATAFFGLLNVFRRLQQEQLTQLNNLPGSELLVVAARTVASGTWERAYTLGLMFVAFMASISIIFSIAVNYSLDSRSIRGHLMWTRLDSVVLDRSLRPGMLKKIAIVLAGGVLGSLLANFIYVWLTAGF